MSDGPDLRYRINAQDEIIFLDDGWRRVADSNDAAELVNADVVGRPLWDFIADPMTRHLYAQLIQRVRQGGVAQFALRCDGPSCRRLLEMTITSVGAGAVEFTTATTELEARETMPLLERRTPRSDEMIRACAWCNRIDVGGGTWVEVEEATKQLGLLEGGPMPKMSHGICESCLAQMEATLEGLERTV